MKWIPDITWIGPYRVIQKLGTGGMGEVVLAHDDRLDRRVAIKRLHDEHAATPHSRERFRREARIAARINHPAIVQIHDVFREGDHDYLVMEYVEGQTLRARRSAGPITVSELLGIAHQIALGMACAHDRGVIHRDLKAENVLLTRSGRAKITDFGIAKIHGDDSVTTEGAVIGTFRAMSPEQALGRTVDHRSDLFSFGTLLYEALSGESPFRAETPYLTVSRLVVDEPRSITEIVPGIPVAFARLIHQLLAKEPVLRPRDFHEVAAALIELAGESCDDACHGGVVSGPAASDEDRRPTDDPRLSSTEDPPSPPAKPSHRRRWLTVLGATAVGSLGIGYTVCSPGAHAPQPTPRVRVAVLAPSVSSTDQHAELSLIAVGIHNAILSDIRTRSGIELVPRRDLDEYIDGATRAVGGTPDLGAIRIAVDADEVIASTITCAVDSCQITLERDIGDAASPPPQSFQLPADTAGRPGATITLHISRLYPDHPARGTSGAIAEEDQERFIYLVREYWSLRSNIDVLPEIEKIRKRSPRSIDVQLFEADVLRHRYLETRDPAVDRLAADLLAEADRLFPNAYDIISAGFDLALSAGRTDDARTSLDRLVALDPDSRTTHLQRAKFERARGKRDQALRALDAAAQRNSFSWSVLYYRALVFRDRREGDNMRAAIAQLLARSPGNYAGLSLRAFDELTQGRPACAEEIYTQLVARLPLYNECATLGWARSQLGRYREAGDAYRCALKMRPDDRAIRLNLAESLLLSGDSQAANELLRSLYHSLANRRSASRLSETDLLVEAQTLAYLGLSDAAMAAKARARIAPLVAFDAHERGLFTAALVHTVLGDLELAGLYVAAALKAENKPADFWLPWFDALRRDPKLEPRLSKPTFAPTCTTTTAMP